MTSLARPIVDLSKRNKGSKLFFGQDDRIIRVDRVNFEIMKTLKDDSEGNTWFSKELHYDGDRARFGELDDIPRRMYQLNIGYQTVMDSGASNGYLDTVRPICSDPYTRIAYTRVGVEETIHAESYSYGLNEIFGEKAESFLDIIYTDPFIRQRMANEIDAFSEVERLRHGILAGTVDPESDEVKQAVLKMLLSAYLLEGIKFPFSFFVTFIINKSYENAIQGTARQIKMIAHDEFSFHVPLNLHVMKILREDESQGYSHLFKSGWFDQEARSRALTIQNEEIDWMLYQQKDGSIPGYNEKIGEHFIKYFTNHRLRGIKVNPLEDVRSNDVIQWYNSYKDLNKTNTAAQEADNTNYVKGGLINDLGTGAW